MAEEKSGQPVSGRRDSAQPLLALEGGRGPRGALVPFVGEGEGLGTHGGLRNSEHTAQSLRPGATVVLEKKADVGKDNQAA